MTAVTNNIVYAKLFLLSGAQLCDLFPQLAGLEGLLDNNRQLVKVERLVDIVICTKAHSFHGSLENTEGRDHDHDNFAVDLLDFLQDLETIHAGQLDIEQNQLRGIILHLLDSLLATGCSNHIVTLLHQRLFERPADQMFIIDNKYSRITHVFPRY